MQRNSRLVNLGRTLIDQVWPKTQKWHVSDTNILFFNPGPHHILALVICFRNGNVTMILSRKDSFVVVVEGLAFVISVIAGIIIGSVVIKQFHFKPRHVGLMLVIPASIMALGAFISTGLGCDNVDIHGLPSTTAFRAGNMAFNNTLCSSSAHCGCSQKNFQPICETVTNTNFFSPCHAGCTLHQNNVVRWPRNTSYRHTSALKVKYNQ